MDTATRVVNYGDGTGALETLDERGEVTASEPLTGLPDVEPTEEEQRIAELLAALLDDTADDIDAEEGAQPEETP